MRLSFKYHTRWSVLQLTILEELSYHLSKLYNIVNYRFHQDAYVPYNKIESEYRSNWHREYLHSHNYQQSLKVLDQDWKSYFATHKDYSKNPKKYLGEPQKPGYKNERRKAEIIFTKLALRLGNHQLRLSLSIKMQSQFHVKSLNLPFPKQVAERVCYDCIQQVKLVWKSSTNCWEIVLIYMKEEEKPKADRQNIMSIDLGLDNLCTITFEKSTKQYLINGKTMKSRNSWFNKEMARLTSQVMKETGNTRFKRSHRMKRLQEKRNAYLHDAMHKASRKVIDLAKENDCKTIVVGDLKGIKQENTRKSFVQIPLHILVKQIEYKGRLAGIHVCLEEESYTSGVSAYNQEPVTRMYYNEKRRVKRGLFVTTEGKLVNSDTNGSLNIMRKYIVREEIRNVVPILVKQWRDNGCMDHPVRLAVV